MPLAKRETPAGDAGVSDGDNEHGGNSVCSITFRFSENQVAELFACLVLKFAVRRFDLHGGQRGGLQDAVDIKVLPSHDADARMAPTRSGHGY